MDIAELIVSKWAKDVAEEGIGRFFHRGRTERIQMLVEELKEANVPLEDALRLKKKVSNYLVTKEGKKGGGKHKGWTQTVEDDYQGVVASVYEDLLKLPATASKISLLPKSSLITEYCKFKYSDFYTEEIEMSVRTFGTLENTMFMEEIDKSIEVRLPWMEK